MAFEDLHEHIVEEFGLNCSDFEREIVAILNRKNWKRKNDWEINLPHRKPRILVDYSQWQRTSGPLSRNRAKSLKCYYKKKLEGVSKINNLALSIMLAAALYMRDNPFRMKHNQSRSK